jgi:hypothetical protein
MAPYPRKGGKVLWMVYRDRSGKRIRESTFTEDWQEAQRKLRERLQARDDKILDVVRKGEQLQFADWVDFFLENYSKPPIRAEKTHEANERAGLHLNKRLASVRSAISAQMISRITFGADSRPMSRSRPLPVSSKKAALSPRRFIRNCGFFAV